MNWEFWFGLITGGAIAYIVCEVLHAINQPKGQPERLAKCTLEAIKRNAELDLASYSDEELIRAIAAGAKILPRRDDKSGGVHKTVSHRQDGA